MDKGLAESGDGLEFHNVTLSFCAFHAFNVFLQKARSTERTSGLNHVKICFGENITTRGVHIRLNEFGSYFIADM
jgi:hypothetical protein